MSTVQLKPKDLMYLKMVLKKPGLDMSPAMSELELQYKDRCALAYPLAFRLLARRRSPLLTLNQRERRVAARLRVPLPWIPRAQAGARA